MPECDGCGSHVTENYFRFSPLMVICQRASTVPATVKLEKQDSASNSVSVISFPDLLY